MGHRRMVRKGRGVTAPPDSPKPLPWRAWQAQHSSKRWYWRAPLAAEWGMEWFVYRLRSLALFDLLELAGRCTVLVVAIFWVLEADNRAKERHYRAWDLINSARSSPGDGGRRDALQDLNKDHVSLAGAPLDQAYLAAVHLERADLVRANLQGADLQGAYLQGANLVEANLQDAYLRGADLMFAYLQGADLHRAELGSADLQGAYLTFANLQGANLQGADLHRADLQGADLAAANLQGANLMEANLQGAILTSFGPMTAFIKSIVLGAHFPPLDLQGPNLDARNLTQEQLNVANGDDHTKLPKGLTRPAHWSRSEGNEGQSGDGTTGQ